MAGSSTPLTRLAAARTSLLLDIDPTGNGLRRLDVVGQLRGSLLGVAISLLLLGRLAANLLVGGLARIEHHVARDVAAPPNLGRNLCVALRHVVTPSFARGQ